MSHKSTYRWVILFLLFAGTTINYLDRIVLSVLLPVIQKEITISPVFYGYILSAFFVFGGIGFILLIFWQIFYKKPETKQSPNEAVKIPWSELLRHREIVGIMLGKFLTDPVWWFYLYWMPTYLNTQQSCGLRYRPWRICRGHWRNFIFSAHSRICRTIFWLHSGLCLDGNFASTGFYPDSHFYKKCKTSDTRALNLLQISHILINFCR